MVRHRARIVLPLRGVAPHFIGDDISETYGPQQQQALGAWADVYLGLYWLVSRRRIEFEKPADVYDAGGPDWVRLRSVYADRLHFYSSMRHSGMTVPTLMRLLHHLRRRGGSEALDALASEQARLRMEPEFSRGKQIRCERLGSILVAGQPRPDVRDYDLGGMIVPQVGRRAREQSQLIKEI